MSRNVLDEIAMTTQDEFDLTIGRLDRIISKLVGWGKSGRKLDEANRQTLKHHAEDMIAAGEKILKGLGKGLDPLYHTPGPGQLYGANTLAPDDEVFWVVVQTNGVPTLKEGDVIKIVDHPEGNYCHRLYDASAHPIKAPDGKYIVVKRGED